MESLVLGRVESLVLARVRPLERARVASLLRVLRVLTIGIIDASRQASCRSAPL